MTITILNRQIFDSGFGPQVWQFEISATDASLVQSNPNALNVVVNGQLMNINNALYGAATLPPYGLLWTLAQENSLGWDWYLSFVPTNTPAFAAGIAAWDNFDGPYTPLITGVTESISITQLPQALVPVYNPITFTIFSPKYAENGFRYLATVKKGVDTIGTYDMTPLADGSGYIDIQKILSNYVSYDWFVTQPTDVPENFNSYIDYSVEFGQEYTTSWPYTNLISYTGDSFYSGYTVLNQTDPSLIHTYVLGDQITVQTTTTGETANVSGLHEVVAVPSQTQVVIDIPYPSTASTVPVSGSTIYSDNRKVGFFNLTTASGLTAFNGALSWGDYQQWASPDYIVPASGDADIKYLSSFEPYTGTNDSDKYYLTDFQDIWMNFYTLDPSDTYYTTISSDLDAGVSFPLSNSPSKIKKSYVSIGYMLDNFFFNQNLKYIDVKLIRINGPLNVLSKTYRFWRDRRCPIEEIQIAFLDLKGSILTIPFTLRVTENLKVDRESFKQAILYPVNSSVDLRDRGTTINSVKVEQSFDLNTDWMNDAQMSLYKEMIASAYTWVKFGDSEWMSCIIQDGGVEVTKQKNKKLFKKSCSIKMANNNPQNI